MNLFKYYDDKKFEMIMLDSGISMRLSPIYSLNDPFESKLDFFSILNESIETRKKNNPWELIDKKSYQDFFKDVEKKFLDYTNDTYGIISLTTQPKNKLMWSHYANSYTGFCIELDLDIIKTEGHRSINLPYYNVFMNVDYQKRRISYDKNLLIRNIQKETHNYLYKIMSTKEKIWEYEEEYRIIATLGDKKPISYFGKIPIHTVVFPASSVKQVILGTLCSKENIDFVKKWLHKQNASHIKLTQLTLCESNYDLKLVDL